MSELSIFELETETSELLPERETMFLNFNYQKAVAVAVNSGFINIGNLAAASATNVAIGS